MPHFRSTHAGPQSVHYHGGPELHHACNRSGLRALAESACFCPPGYVPSHSTDSSSDRQTAQWTDTHFARIAQNHGVPGRNRSRCDGDWPDFAKKLKRLLCDAIRLVRRYGQLPDASYASRRAQSDGRPDQLIDAAWTNREARLLIKRLRRHRDDLFTFLEKPWLPFDNNHAERSIRPAVVMRKNSYANRSAPGRRHAVGSDQHLSNVETAQPSSRQDCHRSPNLVSDNRPTTTFTPQDSLKRLKRYGPSKRPGCRATHRC